MPDYVAQKGEKRTVQKKERRAASPMAKAVEWVSAAEDLNERRHTTLHLFIS